MTETFESMMQEITSGLTGDNKIDYDYLFQQMVKYEDHTFFSQIAEKVLPMMNERRPKEGDAEIARMLDEIKKKPDGSEKAELFESIMREITSGLTGDDKTDRDYLAQQLIKYEDHELHAEITQVMVHMIHERIPVERRAKIARMLDKAKKRAGGESKRIQ